MTEEQKKKIYDLMTQTTVDVIYRFLEMIEEHDDEYKIIVEKDNKKYSLTDISEKLEVKLLILTMKMVGLDVFQRLMEQAN